MASISQPFRLSVLPKIASLNNYATQTEFLQVVDNLTPSTNKISIGISGSSISQYLINPTPKLIFNLPIPSTNVVTACAAVEVSNDTEAWCYCLESGKTSELNFICKPITQDATTSSNAEVMSHLKFKLDSRASNIKIYPGSKRILVVLKNGLIQTFDFDLKLQNTTNISYDMVRLAQFFEADENEGNQFLFVLCELKNKKLCYKLYQVSENALCKELNSIIVENFSFENAKMCYQFGKLYILRNSNELFTYQLPHFQLQNKIKLPFMTQSSTATIKPVSSNRVLITSDNKIHLVDLLHNALLFEKELKNVKTIQLLSTAVISNNTSGNRKTIALGVSTKSAPNATSSLDVIAIDVGTGTLKDSIGKGFLIEEKPKLLKLFDDDNDEDEPEIAHLDFNSILKSLATTKNLESFDLVFFKKLNLKKEYYTDFDRFLNDTQFLTDVLELIFKKFQKDFPKTLTYLLTHPLFPEQIANGLLERLQDNPRLFKQAIVTCPNLPLEDLLSQLFDITNSELCLDLSLRILQDYTSESIKSAIKKVEKMNISSFLDVLLNSEDSESQAQLIKPQIFLLLSLIIDAIGLFALDDATLNRLTVFVGQHVTSVEKNIELLHLLDHNTKNSTQHSNKTAPVSSTQAQNISPYTVEYLEC